MEWTAMSARQFDTQAPDVQGTLFAAGSCGELDDLFSTADDPPQVPVWVRICNHPRCVLTVAHKHGVR